MMTAKVKAIESYSGSPPPVGDMTPLKFEVNDVIRVIPTSLDSSGEDGWFEVNESLDLTLQLQVVP